MMGRGLHRENGFSLIELLVIIVVIGILVSIAMQSMDVVVDDVRRIKTEREMEMLAKAITGAPGITQGSNRCDFGYIGDIGAFPPNLQALYQNTLGHSTWDGPYLPPTFSQDTDGFAKDEWGKAYSYSGGVTLNSTGSGATISKKIADAANDYLVNTLSGVVTDGAGSAPGSSYWDSVNITITVPNGSGGNATKTVHPNTAGSFTFDSLPVGLHPLEVVYVPDADTLHRYTTILPRHKSTPLPYYVFSDGYFTSTGGGGGGGGCDSSGTLILRPDGAGSVTNLSTSGCSNNWECVDEATSDEDATRV
ncbi:MAG: carboxypeptidase regulatory-like domain-containing protein, partial [bacterium]|nr:carboxypeptidase regulatory-like domain-containing protein [bacterium]